VLGFDGSTSLLLERDADVSFAEKHRQMPQLFFNNKIDSITKLWMFSSETKIAIIL
jgi:hypothetical protein